MISITQCRALEIYRIYLFPWSYRTSSISTWTYNATYSTYYIDYWYTNGISLVVFHDFFLTWTQISLTNFDILWEVFPGAWNDNHEIFRFHDNQYLFFLNSGISRTFLRSKKSFIDFPWPFFFQVFPAFLGLWEPWLKGIWEIAIAGCSWLQHRQSRINPCPSIFPPERTLCFVIFQHCYSFVLQ